MADDVPPATERRPLLRRRRLRVVLGLAVLLVAVRVALPSVIAWQIESQGAKATGRVVAVENVDLGILAGTASIDELIVGPPLPAEGEPAPLRREDTVVGFGRLALDVGWLDLLRGRVRVASLVLERPALVLDRKPDGSMVPIVLAGPEAADEEGLADAEAGGGGAAPAETAEAADAAEGEEPSEDGGWPIHLDSLVLERSIVRMKLAGEADTRIVDFQLERFGLRDLVVSGDTITLGSIDVQHPQARLRRDLMVAGAPAPEETDAEREAREAAAAEEGASGFPEIRIDEIHVERADFTVATVEHTLDVALALDARDVSLARPFPFTLRLDVGDEGSLSVEGRARAIPPYYEGSVRWSGIPLVSLIDVADLGLPLSLRTGRSEAELDVVFGSAESAEPEGIELGGRVQLEEIALVGGLDGLYVAWDELDVRIGAIDVPLGEAAARRGPRVELETVTLGAPRVRYARAAPPDGVDGMDGMDGTAGDEGTRAAAPAEVAETEAAAAEPAAPAGPSPTDPRVAIARLELTDGSVEIEDRAVSPAWQGDLRELSLEARDARWPEQTLEGLVLTSRGPGPAALDLRGALRRGEGDLDLELEGLRLAPLSPYLRGAIGQDVEAGTLTMHSAIEARMPELLVDNRLVLYRLALTGAADPEFEKRLGMPLALALALLRDGEGKITLEPRVALDAGSLRLGPILREALTEAVEGAVRAPLKGLAAVGSLVPIRGGPAVRPLAMKPGTTRLDATGGARLGALADLLARRPQLGVSLIGLSDARDDRRLAQAILAERLAEGGDLPDVGAGMLQRRRVAEALERRAAGERGPLEPDDLDALRRMIAAVEVLPERRAALARERAATLHADLVDGQGVDPRQVAIGEVRKGAPGVTYEFAVAAGADPAEPVGSDAGPGEPADDEPPRQPADDEPPRQPADDEPPRQPVDDGAADDGAPPA